MVDLGIGVLLALIAILPILFLVVFIGPPGAQAYCPYPPIPYKKAKKP